MTACRVGAIPKSASPIRDAIDECVITGDMKEARKEEESRHSMFLLKLDVHRARRCFFSLYYSVLAED